MAEEKNTQFNYLLNAMERAGQEAHPAKAGYAGKRKALMAHVRELERKAALADELEQLWNILTQRAKEAVLTMPGESEFDLIQRAMLPRRSAGVKASLSLEQAQEAGCFDQENNDVR